MSAAPDHSRRLAELRACQSRIAACRACPQMAGTPVHGPAVLSPVLLIGQAPGPHEARIGRPFAYTAGKTLFRWFHEELGVSEEDFRARVYMAAVARCFPGKAAGGGDRVPSADEIARCLEHLAAEVAILEPSLILAVGNLAIRQVLGPETYGAKAKLAEVVGKKLEVEYLGARAEVICLPHPSGLSSWHKTEPGRGMLHQALRLVGRHPAWISSFPSRK